MIKSPDDAYTTLGIRNDATPEEVRKAYLGLVRQHPPDRDPERFREIHSAYEMLDSPITQARAICSARFERPNLPAVVDAADQNRPRLPKLLLLALGNGK